MKNTETEYDHAERNGKKLVGTFKKRNKKKIFYEEKIIFDLNAETVRTESFFTKSDSFD